MPAPVSDLVPQWFAELLEHELQPRLQLSLRQVQQLHAHYVLLQRWNKKMNLTSVRFGAEMVTRHYCESLFFGAHLPEHSENVTVADIGSGAGFPGVPLAVLRPKWKLTLVESNQRKAVFLREASRELPNVSVLAQRAEDVSEHFHWIVSRAVNPSEVVQNVPRLAPRVGLMLGESDFSEVKSQSNVAWDEPVRLPWGVHRICIYGDASPGVVQLAEG